MGVRQERESRVRLCGTLRYWSESAADGGGASWSDVSRSGAAFELGRYLRPGRKLWLEFESPENGSALRVRAQVVWCMPRGGNRFVAGVAVYRDCPKQALDFFQLAYAARSEMNAPHARKVVTPTWNLFPRRSTEKVIDLARAQAI